MTKKDGLWIHSLQLYFTSQQLQQLNVYFSDMETCQDLKHNQIVNWIEGEIDKLIQYLCCVIGYLDSRFSSEFLVRLEPTKIFVKNNNCFSYLIRLDNLSVPCQDFHQNENTDFRLELDTEKIPDGFAKIKFEDENSIKRWSDCATSSGYLRRDKIQKKYIELLEEATTAKIEKIQKVITKYSSYNSPGKIVDAETLYHILNIPPQERIFYNSSEDSKKFDSSDIRKFRIEVIESSHLIRLRIGFLSSNVAFDEDIDVILVLGIGLQGWPSTSDYPHRLSFTNHDMLFHQQMATTGFFLMTVCPQSFANKNRTTLWQFFFPSVDCMLTNHYSDLSCVNRTINIVYTIMLNLRRTTPGGNTVGKHIIKTLLWFQMEKLNEQKFWLSHNVSYHVISILNELIRCLRTLKCRSYFFENYNVATNSFRNIFYRHSVDDYEEDANVIETFIHRIYALSSSELIGHQTIMGERRHNNSLVYESLLVQKWNNLLIGMVKSRKTNEKAIGFVSKQIEYIVYLFRAILLTKSVIIHVNNRKIRDICTQIMKRKMDFNCCISLEDASYIVCLLFDQAKQFQLMNQKTAKSTNYLGVSNTDTKMDVQYKEGVKLALKRIKENPFPFFNSDFEAVKFILETLYESCLELKPLRKNLKRYLKTFSQGMFENCWYLEEWKNRIWNDELISLRIFSRLVSERKIKFKTGLLDALQKGWDWAEHMLKLCMKLKNGQDVLFTLANGQTTRRYLILTDEEIEKLKKYQSNPSKYGYRHAVNELTETLKVEGKTECFDEDTPVHFKLRDCSPITEVINNNRRRGMNLGVGNIILSMITLGKFTILQEITQVLPEERRHYILETIQRIIKEKQRVERERGKLGDREETYRLILESCETLPGRLINEMKYNGTSNIGNGNVISLFDDGQSSEITSSSTYSSSFSDKRYKDLAYVLSNPTVYYDAPITYFQYENKHNWRNPTSQPYLKLSSDKRLSLTPDYSCTLVSNGELSAASSYSIKK